MSTSRISQREARKLRRRVAQLESDLAEARKAYRPVVVGDWLVSIPAHIDSKAMVSINVAAKLGFGIRAQSGCDRIDFYAVRP